MMQGQGFTEKDWKLFRSKIAGWQLSYTDRLNREYIKLLSGKGSPADKFWKLDKRIREDKKKVGVQVDMRRSVMIDNISYEKQLCCFCDARYEQRGAEIAAHSLTRENL